jgi:hypothetical protein
VSFSVLFVCICVLYYCHRVATQLRLTNISYIIISYHIIPYHITYHITSYIISCIISYISYIISYLILSHLISYHIISYIISYIITSYISYHMAQDRDQSHDTVNNITQVPSGTDRNEVEVSSEVNFSVEQMARISLRGQQLPAIKEHVSSI